MRVVERFEYKYALDYKNYLAFKYKISEFMKHDEYTEIGHKNRYFVRSLYYDTYDFKHFNESEEGMYGRIKCRARSYEYYKEKADVISIEIKTKQGANVKKYSQLIPAKEYHFFEKNGYFRQSSEVLDEFTRLIHLSHLEPKLIVEYEREGYQPLDGSDLRLTFDFNVRSGQSKDLFKDKTIHTRMHNHAIICEIKCGMDKPAWLESLIRDYGLKMIGNSKYVQAVERIYPSMIYGRDLLDQPL